MDEELVCQAHEVHKDAVERASGFMPDPETVEQLADFFKIFGDGTRVKIMLALDAGEMCVCDIAQLLGMSQSAISHQLRALKQSKLVKYRREGKAVFYSLADGHVRTILGQGIDHISE